MKQVTQRLRDGQIEVLDVPVPVLDPQGVLVDIRASVLSPGTEATKVRTARQNLVAKARSRPDQARQVLEKARRDGLRQTATAVRARLDQPEPLGYSAAGAVLAVGQEVAELKPGDRVACGGGGYAAHAEIDYVPANLCVRLPDEVEFEHGAFATLGAIAVQGIRQAEARLGERIAVIGLGLIGQLTAQLLKVAGCQVIGIDLDEDLVNLGLETGALDQGVARSRLGRSMAANMSSCDAVIITAATPSHDPVQLAAELSRDRGRVVIVGDVGMRLPRPAYYQKELELRLSRSYGPGRYDREYEERGLDYPIGYVRWTEQRNMAAFVHLLEQGRIDVRPLIRTQVPVEQAADAYQQLLDGNGSAPAIVLRYPVSTSEENGEPPPGTRPRAASSTPTDQGSIPLSVGVIGAGSFASRVLIPALQGAGFSLEAIGSASGLSAQGVAERFRFRRVDAPAAILGDPAVGLAVIATRHATHAALAQQALRAGKAVFVEKPPALTLGELADLRDARTESGLPVFVGFNRRHAPLVNRLRNHVRASTAPLEVLIRVSAGALPPDHWLLDPREGGGRLIGEGCHFVDLACWIVGSWPIRVSCDAQPVDGSIVTASSFSVTLTYADDSLATILYGTGGAPRVPKEYIEAHSDGRSAILDDFRRLTLLAGSRRRVVRGRGQDKGHRAEMAAVRKALLRQQYPAEDDDPLESMAVTFAAIRAAEQGRATRPARLASLSANEPV